MRRRRVHGPAHIALGAALLGVLAASPFAAAASLAGRVTIEGKPAVEVVVALHRSGEAASSGLVSPLPKQPRVVMDQKHLAFHPQVLPVLRGTIVEFTNNDDVEHNVFSPSKIAGAFNLGTYSHGEVREVRLDTPGEVDVLCNVHMEMEAHILVLEEPYFAVSAPDGAYSVGDLPAGEYELSLWNNGWLTTKQRVVLRADEDARLDVTARR